MVELDPRLVKLSIEVNGRIKTYDGLAIHATGTKYANPLQNEAEITIFNLDKTTQDYILTETSPYNLNRTPKIARLEAGRISYGATLIYSGNVITARPSQPPDIGITLKCLTANFYKGKIISRSCGASISLNDLSKQIAADMNLSLLFQAKDKQIANYSHTGAVLDEVDNLSRVGNINAYVDNASLVIKTLGLPRTDSTRILNSGTGLIGIPELTERGLKVKFLLDNRTQLGGGLRIQSTLYPAVNGDYVIYKLSFDVSNRDTPFYYIAECIRRNL